MITELDTIVNVVANHLGALTPSRELTAERPSEIAQLLCIAVATANKVDQSFIWESIDIPLLGFGRFVVCLPAICDNKAVSNLKRLRVGPDGRGGESEGRNENGWSTSSSSRSSSLATPPRWLWWRSEQAGREVSPRATARRRRTPCATSRRSSRNCALCKSAIRQPATSWKARSKT